MVVVVGINCECVATGRALAVVVAVVVGRVDGMVDAAWVVKVEGEEEVGKEEGTDLADICELVVGTAVGGTAAVGGAMD